MTCSVAGCDRRAETRGWCRMHYGRWRRTGDPTAVRKVALSESPICSVAGCGRRTHAHDMCNLHGSRVRRTGSTSANHRYGGFWLHVEKTDTCWLWVGARQANGYGQANGALGRGQAHRVAYELLVGPIPEGLHLDHLCRVRNCVNPDHLEPVTQAENNRRARFARTGP